MTSLVMILQAGASFCLSAALAVFVAMLRGKSGPQWALLGILCCISIWTAGVVVAWSDPESVAGLRVAIIMVFSGSCFVPGLTF